MGKKVVSGRIRIPGENVIPGLKRESEGLTLIETRCSECPFYHPWDSGKEVLLGEVHNMVSGEVGVSRRDMERIQEVYEQLDGYTNCENPYQSQPPSLSRDQGCLMIYRVVDE